MRSSWDGVLRFGLVAIPVGLVPAITDRGTGFKTLHRECSTPVKRPAFCELHDRVLDAAETVRGYEVARGQFVTVEDDELAAVVPEKSSVIEIECLVAADRIDPARVERTFYLSASETPIGRRPYVLLHRLLVQRKDVGIARLVNRGHEWVAAIAAHPSRNVLLLQKLAFSDAFVDPTEIEVALRDVELQDRELELGGDLAAKVWRTKPGTKLLESDHQERVRQLIDAKLAGGKLVMPERPESETETPPFAGVDLTEQLRASLRPRRRQSKTKPRPGTRAVKG